MTAAPAPGRHRDGVTSAWLLGVVGLWDAGGGDLPAVRWFGGADGFPWRTHWMADKVLHDGGRGLAWAVFTVLVVVALRTPIHPAHGPSRNQRLGWLGVMLLAVLAVPAFKRFSGTSCPWSLAEFGGTASFVSHWHWGAADGGPGHCFPSGHAVAAFAFLGMHFLWRDHDRRRGRLWLAAVCIAGTCFGAAQLARGAHYPSHTLWSAWLCWTLCAAAAALGRRIGTRMPRHRPAALQAGIPRAARAPASQISAPTVDGIGGAAARWAAAGRISTPTPARRQ